MAALGATDVPETADTIQVRDVLRPDGRLVVRIDEDWTPRAAAGAAQLARRLRVPVLVHVDEDANAEIEALVAAGFAISRREAVVGIPLAPALEELMDAALPVGIAVRSATDVDEDRLRLLDDELRQDVPGASGWKSTPAQFHDHTFADPAFDPRTYLVAVDESSGEYVALVRVWMNASGPRLGLVAVRRAYRRRGIATALLAHSLQAVREMGATEVTAEYDLENDASRALFERLGARRLGTTVELAHEGASRAR
jgi:RimJ/RimL family protein N-acetyltransferase